MAVQRRLACGPHGMADADARKGGSKGVGGNGGNAAAHALALFSRDGRRIYLGQARGILAVLDRASGQFLDVLRVRMRPGPATYVRAQDVGWRAVAWHTETRSVLCPLREM